MNIPLFGQSLENRRVLANQQRLLEAAQKKLIFARVDTITSDSIAELEPGKTFSLAWLTQSIQSRLKNMGIAAPNAPRQKIQRLLEVSPHVEPLPKPANWKRQDGLFFKRIENKD